MYWNMALKQFLLSNVNRDDYYFRTELNRKDISMLQWIVTFLTLLLNSFATQKWISQNSMI